MNIQPEYQLRKKPGGSIQGLPPLYVITTPVTIIGRQPGNVHLLLPSNMISRQHAVIERDQSGNYFIRDNGSTNGTLVNNEYVEKPMKLLAGDNIVFGGENDEMVLNFSYLFETAFAAPFSSNKSQSDSQVIPPSLQVTSAGKQTEVNIYSPTATKRSPNNNLGGSNEDWQNMFASNKRKSKGSSSRKSKKYASFSESKKLYDMDGMKKSGYLTEMFCKKGNVIELDQLVAAKVNIKEIKNSIQSPFSIAITSGNAKIAMRILHHSNGEADISNCDLKEIPEAVLRMVQANLITKLDLSHNQLVAIPADLSSIRYVDIGGNPLTAVPHAYRDNWAALKKFLTTAVSKAGEFKRRKVIVVGGESSGKTSVTKLLTGGKVDISKKINDENISIRDSNISKMEITYWNFGEPVISAPTHNFFMDVDCLYLITFDLSNLKLQDLEYWLKLIKSTSSRGSVLAIAVGTHSDKVSEEEIENTIEILQAKFPKRVFPFLNDIIAFSCKNSSGLSTVKKKLKELSNHSSFPSEVSSAWIQLNMKIKSVRATGRQYVIWLEYAKWAEGVGIFKEEELGQATNFLNSIGALTSFKKRFNNDIIFLDPNGLVTLMNKLVTHGSSLEETGLFTLDTFKCVCTNFPESLCPQLFNLLVNFNIFIYLPNQGAYLAPSSLKKLAPRGEISKIFPVKLSDDEACFGRVFKFQQLPLGLLNRILSSTLNIPDLKCCQLWRFGCLVQYKENVVASIEYFSESYKIAVELRFNRKTQVEEIEKIALGFWRQLLENVRTQIEGFCSGISWNEFVPCIHCIRRGVFRDKVYLFDYQQVIDSIDNPFMYCNNIESTSRCISRMEVAPDIALRDLPQVSMRRLTIGEQIGEGGFGVVYKGTLEGKVVAVKELTSKNLDGDLFREFQVEAFIQSLLDHPNCVKLYGLTANPPRMVLEFISGGDLCHLIHPKSKPKPTLATLPWSRRFEIAFDIAKGLYHMQTQNPPVIHRDIRSPNIFMTKEGKALIGDFGLARQVNPIIGGMLGTWQWLAPECIDSVELNMYDERTDIYSFGMVLWELVTCDVPFEEFMEHPRFAQNGKLKLQDLKRAIIDEHLRPTLPQNTPNEIKSIIERCWLVDVSKRPSCKEILDTLGRLCNKSNEVASEISGAGIIKTDMNSRLSSHLVSVSAPTIRAEKPLASFKLDRAEGKPRYLITVDDTVWSASSQGFIHILQQDSNGTIVVKEKWQAHIGRIAVLLNVENRVWSCSDDDGSIRIWNIQQRVIENSVKPFGDCSRGCGPSNLLAVDDFIWVASAQLGKIAVCNVKTAEVECFIENEELLLGMSGMVLHKEHVWIANCGKIHMYDYVGQDCIGSFQAHHSGRMTMFIASVGDAVWTTCSSELRIWDAPSLDLMSLAKEQSVGDAKFICMEYSVESGRVYTGSFNGELVMWNARNGVAMQEMVSTSHSIASITILNGVTWCVTALCEVFAYNADFLHPKPKVAKLDIKTIRTSNSKPQKRQQLGLPSERSKLNRPNANSNPGRKKEKGITLRKNVDESDLSEEEVARKLANPMITLRKANKVPSSLTVTDIRILASNGQVLPCNLQADGSTKVSTLLQRLIPTGLQQMNILQAGLPFEVMYYNNNSPTRFKPSDLAFPVLRYGENFVLNRIPTENLQSILMAHNIEIYCVVNNDKSKPSAQIQIFSG